MTLFGSWQRSPTQQLSRSEQLGWATGSLGTAVVLGVLTSYGLYFMTTYLGIGALLAGQLLGWSKFYDMLSDPVMGHISDRTDTRWGRRRPYLLLGAIVAPLALIMLFEVPDLGDATIAYLALLLILYATAFTIFNVPYLAMAAEFTTDYHERTVVMSQRIFFSTLGVLCISVVGPNLIKFFGGGETGYIRMSWVMAGICALTMSIAFWTTRNTRFVARSPRSEHGIRDQFRFIWRNHFFRYYMLAKICMFTAQSSVQVTLLFFGRYVLGRDEMILAAFGVGYTAGSLIALPVWSRLIQGGLGKRGAFMICSIGLGTVFLSWLLAVPQEPAALLYLRFGLLGVFSAGSMVSASAMLPDIMHYDREQTGINQEGLYAAAFSLVEKLANTIGPILLGTLLGLTGFVSTQGGELVAQPESAILAIKAGVSIVPFALACAGAWLIRSYTLDASKLGSETVTPGRQPNG